MNSEVDFAIRKKIAVEGGVMLGPDRAVSLEQNLTRLVSAQGGRILPSPEPFKVLSDTVRVTCDKGHPWSVSADRLLKGQWCPKCTGVHEKRRRSFEALKAKVRKVRGEVVTPLEEYGGTDSKARFHCMEGHEWMGQVANILFVRRNMTPKNWCPVCTPRKNAKKSIETLQEIARAKGGECLSDHYLNSAAKLRWRCAKGHEWLSTGQIILGGSWCPTCSVESRSYSVNSLSEFALERGGRCLSTHYGQMQDPYEWECSKGHRFSLSFYYAKKGAWCPECKAESSGEGRLEEMRALAKARGGECLSTSYRRNSEKLHWRCGKGHEWHALFRNIMRGTWCPECFHIETHGSLNEFQKIAEEKGGECLSTNFLGIRKKLLFQCREGHEWKYTAATIRKGRWCPVCAGKRKTLEDMQELAKSRGGKCLSPAYRGINKPLLWECEKGHQWRAAPQNVIHQGSWCRRCSYGSYSFQELFDIAKSKGGQILSPYSDYKNGQSIFRMKCKEGHVWEMRAGALGEGSWCRKCGAQRKRMPIEKIRAYAEERGGILLTEKLSTQDRNWVFFRCAEGHVWRARGDQAVRVRSWCRKCVYEGQRSTIEEMQALAREKGGVCLSKQYLGIRKKLQWRCSAGHTWWTTPAIIRHGSWCVKCTSSTVNSFEKLDVLVKKRGGEILSKQYMGTAVKHEFRCQKGHRWWTAPNSIVGGHWCHACAGCEMGSIEKLQKVAKKFGGKCLSTEYLGSKEKHLWECKAGHQFWKKPNHVMARGQWCGECRRSR